MKTLLLCGLAGFAIGFLTVVALNSARYVIKVDVVAPEDGYTSVQREQLNLLMQEVK